jgi:hypothetical protein
MCGGEMARGSMCNPSSSVMAHCSHFQGSHQRAEVLLEVQALLKRRDLTKVGARA